MPLGNCSALFAVTIEVTVTKYINFCNVIIDTVNKQINTGFTKKGVCILSCLKGTAVLQCKEILHILKFFWASREYNRLKLMRKSGS